MRNVVFITGASGQDGSILCEKFLEKEYKVVGLIRRKSNADLGNLNLVKNKQDIEIIEGDVTDITCLQKICKMWRPNVFINTAAQSHVGLSFSTPVDSVNNTGVGVLNCLEAIKDTNLINCNFLQLSTSEMYGGTNGDLLNELSPMMPKSPYAAAKLYGYHITKIYRESYGINASNVICFNHEEPGRRGHNFVTRKITLGLAKIVKDPINAPKIKLGNIDAKRDWGLASDYCDAMIKVVESSSSDDYVVATGKTHSVKEFLKIAFNHVGIEDYSNFIEIDQSLWRPNEVHVLIGDYSKINKRLGWEPKTCFSDLVKSMVDWDINNQLDSMDTIVGHSSNGIRVISKAY
jgi:GDPmannose 4,6-dehydratase